MKYTLIISFLLFALTVKSQDLEVSGSVVVIDMVKDNKSDSIVVRQSDGTLAIREISSMSDMPIKPEVVGSLELPSSISSFAVSGKNAYLIDNQQKFRILDISNASSPVEVGSVTLPGFSARGLNIIGKFAYAFSDGPDLFYTIDISNVSDPIVVKTSSTIIENASDLITSGRHAYLTGIGLEFSFVNDLIVFDLSVPSEPRFIGGIDFALDRTKYFDVKNGFAYVTTNGVLHIIDISEPKEMNQIGSINIGNVLSRPIISGNFAYIIDLTSDELKVIDISDPIAPLVVSSESTPEARSVYVSGDLAFVIASSETRILNISDTSNPVEVGVINQNMSDIEVIGRYAYSYSSNEFSIISISNMEYTALSTHSLETGQLQVRNDLTALGKVDIRGGLTVGSSGIYSDGGASLAGDVTIAHGFSNTGIGGLRIENDSVLNNTNRWWNFYVQNGDGDLILSSPTGNGNNNAAGEFKASTGTYNALSDRRQKKNISNVEDILDEVTSLEIHKYHMITEEDDFKQHYGLMAQEVEKKFPEIVHYDKESDVYRMEYSTLGVLAIQAIKELTQKVKNQEQELKELRKLISEITGK